MVSGGSKVKYRLLRMIPEMESAVSEAMIEAADRMVHNMKTLVPKDTGRLASTIHRTEPHKSKKGNLVISVVAGDKSTLVGKDKRFQLARLIEFGSQKRAAQPFFFPVYRANKRAARASIRKAIRNVLRSG